MKVERQEDERPVIITLSAKEAKCLHKVLGNLSGDTGNQYFDITSELYRQLSDNGINSTSMPRPFENSVRYKG